ncbi:protein of unknown function [Saccharicrinis carchari]|uniref:DUF4395 domain-containing protein n=2 Tax=Saccharicrinis carchari TaxID=1168039 RepID=A0A521CLT6_SACCC|nr:protein of unknown function [Saccharicrinis carchari]
MKDILCPVSPERFSDNIPRLIGLFVVVLLISYVITHMWFIPAFLLLDFYMRGFGKSKYSLLLKLALTANNQLRLKGELIDKAPKIFAARLGFVFTFLILALHLFGFTLVSNSLAIVLVVFAALECVANFCVGCVVFTYFVKPYVRG